MFGCSQIVRKLNFVHGSSIYIIGSVHVHTWL